MILTSDNFLNKCLFNLSVLWKVRVWPSVPKRRNTMSVNMKIAWIRLPCSRAGSVSVNWLNWALSSASLTLWYEKIWERQFPNGRYEEKRASWLSVLPFPTYQCCMTLFVNYRDKWSYQVAWLARLVSSTSPSYICSSSSFFIASPTLRRATEIWRQNALRSIHNSHFIVRTLLVLILFCFFFSVGMMSICFKPMVSTTKIVHQSFPY